MIRLDYRMTCLSDYSRFENTREISIVVNHTCTHKRESHRSYEIKTKAVSHIIFRKSPSPVKHLAGTSLYVSSVSIHRKFVRLTPMSVCSVPGLSISQSVSQSVRGLISMSLWVDSTPQLSKLSHDNRRSDHCNTTGYIRFQLFYVGYRKPISVLRDSVDNW